MFLKVLDYQGVQGDIYDLGSSELKKVQNLICD